MDYSQTHVRQLELLPEDLLNKSIKVIGLGGIGSPTAYLLAKMGFKNITLCDFDIVDNHNIATQMYGIKDIGEFKSHALHERILQDFGARINHDCNKINELGAEEIVIMGLDSMDERIRLFNNSLESGVLPQYLIDARMGLEFTRIYAFSPYDSEYVDAYKKQLYPSSEAEALPCTARAVGYNTFFIASIIASLISNIVRGEDVPFEIMGDIGKFGIKTFDK